MAQPASQQHTVVLNMDDIAAAVEARRSARRRAALKWIVGTTVPTLVAGAFGLVNYLGPIVSMAQARPYIDELDSPHTDAERLVILGTAFGEGRGSVELFYKRIITNSAGDSSLPSRTITITLSGSQIETWSDDRIVARTTMPQREALLASIGVEGFRNLMPYIRVITSNGRRRSPTF